MPEEKEKLMYDPNAVWEAICALQGHIFTTAKGLQYSYEIRGYEIFFSRKEKSVTKASVELALERVKELQGIVKGPKKLNVFGASYLYPVFQEIGVILQKK